MKKQNDKAAPRQFPQLLLLEASAGSGKTHALSRRYVEFLLATDVAHNKPGNLLAITFTKNAAREMKERILLWLKNLALGSDPAMMAEIQGLLAATPERIADQARLQIGALLERYSDFQVQTIDSFTNRLAQASARELGFRPDFTVTTNQDELIEYALAKLYARIGPGRDEQLTKGMDRFLALVNTTRGGFVWDPRPRLSEQFARFLGIEAKESGRLAFTDQQQAIDRLLDELRAVHDEVGAFACAHDIPFQGDAKLLEYIAKRNFDGIFARKTYDGEHTPVKKTGLQKSQSPAYEQSKAIWAQTGPIVAGLAVAVAINDVAPYHLPYDAFKQELDQAKRRQGVCYIDDIARTLAESLRTEMIPEIYLALGERIHHYLIDEFQDTDPAQWRSLHPLLCETLAADGSVFLVGDLKQAIYMFRKADYRIMRGLRAEIERQTPLRWLPASVADNATVSHLEHNFRSGQVIVEYVDQTFKQILPQLITAGRLKPDLSGLTGYQQTPSPDNMGRGYVSVRHFMAQSDSSDDGGIAIDDPVAEQDANGTGIQSPSDDAVRQSLLAIIKDATDRGYGHGDIAVLAAYNSELEQAIDWLTQANIPAASSSGLDIRRRKAVAELLALLRWLHSPIDNLAWAGVVNSEMLRRAARRDGIPWGAAQAQALLVAAGQRAGQHGYLYQECRKEPSFMAIWQRYCEGLYNVAGFTPVYDLACLAVTAFGLMNTTPDEVAAVLQLLEAINRHETEGHGSLGDFLDRCESGEAEDFGLELPTGLPAVQLLSFHKAKGMGFPVVINLLSGGGGGKAVYYDTKNGSITVYHITKSLAARTAGYPGDLEALRADRDADDQVQRLNSLYVACTRASDELYNLVTCPPPDAKGNLPLYQVLFPEQEFGTKSQRLFKSAAAPLAPLDLPEMPPKLPAARWQQEDAWTVARYTESRKGEYLHRVLQDIEYLPADIEALAAKLLQQHRLLAPDCDPGSLHSTLCAFLKNTTLKEWFTPREGRSVWREAEFIAADGSIVRMDRLVVDPGAVTVIDFKTGGESPAGQNGHRLQLSRYIDVLREVYPRRSVTGLIAYWDGTIIEVRP